MNLLRSSDVRVLTDVRIIPRSRTNPQYNSDTLADTLARFDIAYKHITALGGRRPKAPGISPHLNAFWRIQSFHNFADYALGDAFRAELGKLRKLGHAQRCAIMCAEAMWWRCHRRIIADYLIAAGETVFHILSKNRIEPARMTEAAERASDGSLIYPEHPWDSASRERAPR